ncbi:MAG: hypothetical protein P4L69_15685 [Desulfosporosinus sp.]|nr:hypothetical protein [Desulfosporosinus sp.]
MRRWLYKEGFAVKKGDGTKRGDETHLLLNGGRCRIPDAKNAEFLNHYAHSLFEGDWLYIVEMKTAPVFYYMNEFDIKLKDREISRDEIDTIVRVIQGIMSAAFPTEDIHLVVSTAPPKAATLDDDTPVIQSGIHLNWRIHVDGVTAWQLRAWTLRALDSEMATFPLMTRWGEAFDDCVFEANGLRMIGSRKAIVCSQCKGQSYKREGNGDDEWGAVCSVCQDVGRVDLGRPYSLLYVADRDGSIDVTFTNRLQRDPMELVLNTTIRAINPDGSRPASAMALTFPSPEIQDQVERDALRDRSAKKHAPKPKKGAQKDKVATKDLEKLAKKKQERRDSLEEVAPDDPVYPAIAEYIHNEFNGLPNVTNIKKGGSGDFYIINSDCHYCYNKRGLHNHSDVFYILRPKGCVQRCFCPKDVVQPGGKRCSAYISTDHKVPSDLLVLVFSEGVLRTRNKEEKNAKLAAEVFPDRRPLAEDPFGDDEELGMIDDDQATFSPVSAAAAAPPMADARVERRHNQRPSRPRFDPKTVIVVRPGSTEYKYNNARDALIPRYTATAFLDAVKSANYKIIR